VPWEPPKTKGADRAAAIEEDMRAKNYPFKRTISFMEVAYWSGPIELAIGAAGMDRDAIDHLERLAWGVRYFGKRGSFVQLLSSRRVDDEVISQDRCFGRRADLIPPDEDWPARFIQRPADDLGPHAEFDRISIASPQKVRAGRVSEVGSGKKVDRFVALPFILPLRLRRSGRSFAHYVRTDQAMGELKTNHR
jgi:hypothetical protein